MRDFRDLQVWNRSHRLTLRIYALTDTFPRNEQYGLVSQMRRAAASVPINIAEGCGRGTERDFARFLQMAMGSASEREYELILAHDLQYIAKEAFEPLAEE